MEKFKNLGEMLDYNSQIRPNHIAYTFTTDDNQELKITYRELEIKAKVIAALIQKNAKHGDRILLIYPPGIELIAAFFACMYTGTMAVLCYPPVTPDLAEKLLHITHNAEPSLCLTTKEYLSKVSQLNFAKKVLKIPMLNVVIKNALGKKYQYVAELSKAGLDEFPWLATDNLLQQIKEPINASAVDPQDIAFLQYTSGSTGAPKGVMVSHANLLSNLAGSYKFYTLGPDDHCVSWLPPYHDMGLIGGILKPMFIGFTSHLTSPMAFLKNPAHWLQMITHYKATCSVAPNFAYDLCVKRVSDSDKLKLDLSSLKVLMSGAEPVRDSTIDRFTKTFGNCGFKSGMLKPCYGLAEGTLFIAGTLTHEHYTTLQIDKEDLQKNQLTFVDSALPTAQSIICCGQIIPDHQVIIVNPETKELCGDEKIGEIWIAGPSVAQGYWRQPTLTADIFKAHLASGAGPYLRSGDLGFMKDGKLTICGRIKDVIIVRGKKYYPQDIERCIDETMPNWIRTGCSVAFSVNDENFERLVLLAEVKDPSWQEHQDKIINMIIEAVSKEFGLPLHHVGLVPAKSLKKTTSGKVRRSYTKDLYLQNKLNYLHLWTQSMGA